MKKVLSVMQVTINGYEVEEKTPNLPSSGTSCVIYLPPEWNKKKVKVVRIEE